jgi:uncharacterized repeat protein (TIGR03847 family)
MSAMDIVPDVFTADYVGEPGHRTFYIQVRSASATSTLLAEKQQVALLADKLRELLVLVDSSDTVVGAAPERDPALAITPPLEPEWRVGAMGLAYEEEDDRVIIVIQQASESEEQEIEEDEEEGIRITVTRDLVRGFVLHALAVVAEGRPLCQLCGLPIDPEGHVCPASNGHRGDG